MTEQGRGIARIGALRQHDGVAADPAEVMRCDAHAELGLGDVADAAAKAFRSERRAAPGQPETGSIPGLSREQGTDLCEIPIQAFTYLGGNAEGNRNAGLGLIAGDRDPVPIRCLAQGLVKPEPGDVPCADRVIGQKQDREPSRQFSAAGRLVQLPSCSARAIRSRPSRSIVVASGRLRENMCGGCCLARRDRLRLTA